MTAQSGLALRLGDQAAWPDNWEERIRGWAQGAAYRMDWPSPALLTAVPKAQIHPLLEERPVLSQPAIIGPNRSGRLMAFSARAVNSARVVWAAYGLGVLNSESWHIAWLNGANPGSTGFRSPWAIEGLDLMDVGADTVAFTPEVLGPLGRIGPDGILQPSSELSLRHGDGGTFIRGAQVFDGYWRYGYIEPFTGEEGWLFLSVRLPF